MAINRKIPTCPKCGQPIAKAIYRTINPHNIFVGDDFIMWKPIEHKCTTPAK